MDTKVREFNELWRDTIRFRMDDPRHQLQEAQIKLENALNGELGREVRAYVQPYIDSSLPSQSGNTRKTWQERERWYAAACLKLHDTS
ncbi:MAG: hypothetical protein AAB916_00845 [Patescibacteria group bacterium]